MQRHLINLALIVIAMVGLFWKVFFLGQTLLDVQTLNNQLPWGYHAGENSDYAYNRRDPTDMYVTREYFVVQAYRDGESPLWNPYTMAGHPIYADGVTRIWSPSLLFYTFLDVPLGYTVARIAELTLAAIFLYAFLIAIGVGPRGGLVGAIVFAFSAHAMFHVTHLGWWGGLMWLPLIFLFVDRALRRRSWRQALIAGILLAAQLYCGFMANQIYYFGAVGLCCGFHAYCRRGHGTKLWPLVRWPLITLAITIGAGLALSAPAWAPEFELLKYSNRLIVPTETGYIYLPPWYLATLVFPNLFGSAYDPGLIKLFAAVGVSHDHILYLGIATLAPLGFCLYWLGRTARKRKSSRSPEAVVAVDATHAPEAVLVGPVEIAVDGAAQPEPSFTRERVVFFVFLAGFALLIMIAAPAYVHLTRFLPVVRSIRVIVRAGVLYVFAASVLAAFGTDLLLESAASLLAGFYRLTTRVTAAVFALTVVAVIVALIIRAIGLSESPGAKGKIVFLKSAANSLSQKFLPPDSGILVPLAMLLAVVVLIKLMLRGNISRPALYAALVVLLFLDLAWNSRNFDHTFNRAEVYPHTRITDLLHTLPPGRVLPTPSDIDQNLRAEDEPGHGKIIAPTNTLLPYQIATVTGKDQLFPKWYQQYGSLIDRQPNMSHVVFDRDSSPFLDLLNVKYLMVRENAAAPPASKLIATADGLSVYENLNAMPRAFFASAVSAATDDQDALKQMRTSGFDPKRTTVVEFPGGTTPVEFAGASGSAPGQADVSEARRNRLVVATSSEQQRLLVVSDTFYPGWIARIDGSTVPIYKTNVTMRGVIVPAGQHQITFSFEPAIFKVSCYLSAAAAIVALLALGSGLFRRAKVQA